MIAEQVVVRQPLAANAIADSWKSRHLKRGGSTPLCEFTLRWILKPDQ